MRDFGTIHSCNKASLHSSEIHPHGTAIGTDCCSRLRLPVAVVLWPLLLVLKVSLTNDQGVFSLSGLTTIFQNAFYLETLWNSLKLGAVTAIASTLIGYIFAYAITRTTMPLKGFFRMIATLPIISPPFVLSLSVIFLFGRQGLIVNNLLGLQDFDVYGLPSLALVQILSSFPIAYLTLAGILETIDPAVEDAAYNLGAKRGYIFRTVTLPLSLPGIASAILLVFVNSLQDFGNPMVLGGNFSTLAVQAYLEITGSYNLQVGSILAVTLLVPSLIAFFLQRYWLGKKCYVTVSGKPSYERKLISDVLIVRTLFALCLFFTASVLLFYGTVLYGSFVKIWGVNHTLTLDNYRFVLDLGFDPLKNSLYLSLIATPVGGILGMIIAFLVVRKRFLGRRAMESISLFTFAVPGTIVGIGYILAFNEPPLALNGTAALIIIAFLFRNMPVAIESGTSALLQIDPCIEEASTSLGAGSFTTFRRITLPLIKSAFFSGLVYEFVRAMTAVSAVIFLISAQWNLVTIAILSHVQLSRYSSAAAYVMILIVFIIAAIKALEYLVGLMGRKNYG
ncbi:ABC transporter permease [Anaerosporomusa subterranea]|uniref:ABC transporter permease n=1 Tax=Anaerosporomusa subterranea TaxID=1794912 RepID=UPI000A475B66|nr:iron ABC transporter permease [Anaerosporomusa subterranea]